MTSFGLFFTQIVSKTGYRGVDLSDLIVHVQLQPIYGPSLLRIEPEDRFTALIIHVVSPVFGSGVRQGDGVL